MTTEVVSIGESLIEVGILLYISYRLETDRSLAKWQAESGF
jgi:hypothetical protein